MVNDYSWKSFSEYNRLQNDRYVKHVELLQRLQSEERYPVILYPQTLNQQISKKFKIGKVDIKQKEDSYIYLQDFLEAAKKLNIRGNDWNFLDPPLNPNCLSYPIMPSVPTERKERYQSYNLGCLIPIVIMAVLFTLPAFFMEPEAPELGIIIGLLWIPAVVVMAHQWGVGKAETKTRIVTLSKAEIEQKKEEAKTQYKEDVENYERLKVICEKNFSDYNAKLVAQSAIIDRYADKIAAFIFQRCLLYHSDLHRNPTPPKRGVSEDILFYHLMKEFPDYTKMDIRIGPYSPDIILYCRCYSPIDVEIDEPYEFNTKKEIHYIGCGDEQRNRLFTGLNWFVIRFSENQIKHHLKECIMILKAFTVFIKTGNAGLLYPIESIVRQIQEPRWTKEVARVRAIENYRDN